MKFAKLVLAVLFLSAVPAARAGELDMLLDRLVEKSVLDPGEAQEIRIGTQEEVKKEISRQRHATLPMWLQTMKMHGDVRLRYQFNDNHNRSLTQHRGRFRLRFFVDAKVNEKIYAGFGFASGSSADPRSTNVKGHEVGLSLGLMRAFAVDLDYYQAQAIKGAGKLEKLFQADINLKF